MKTIKVIIGIIIAFFSTNTIFEMYNEESGAGLFEAFSGYIIFMAIAIWLVYSGSKDEVTKVKNINLENDANSAKNYDKNRTDIANLKDLKEKGILTEEEYNQKANKIEREKKEENLKNSQEYKQLKSLFDNGVLTKEEFILKTEILRNKIKEVVEISSESFYQTLESYKAVRIVKNKDKKYKVFIDKKQIINGAFEVKLATNYNEISAIKFKALDGEIIELYFIIILTKLIVEMKNENHIERGDNVYLKNGEPAKSGEYSNGFMSSKIVVENGKFVKFK